MAGNAQGFDEVMSKMEDYVKVSGKVGTDVKSQAELTKQAFVAQQEFLKGVPGKAKPSENELGVLLKPTADKIAAVQKFKEEHKSSPYLSSASEAVSALGWVTMPSKPADYVKQVIESTKYYTNRVLKESGSGEIHKQWVDALIAVLDELEKFVRKHHNSGLAWGK